MAAVASTGCTDCWTTKASMHAAHVGVAAVAVGGSLYAIGGGTATVEAYDPATDTWTTKAPLPTLRSYTGAAEVRGIIYVVGGFDSTGSILADLLAYDPTTDTWTVKAPMPTGRDRLAVGVVDGILYAAGGEAHQPPYTLATLEAYDPATDTWTTKTAMPTARSVAAAAAVNGTLYIVGGGDANGRLVATPAAYDPATDTWTTKAPMPTPRGGLGVSALNGMIYTVGGAAPGAYLATLEAYDPGSDRWWTRPSMPTPRDFLGAANLGGALYAIGGFNDHPDLSAVAVEAYNPPPSANECAFPPAGTIWCDDFEIDRLSGYYEVGSPTPPNTFARTAAAGVGGSYGMRAVYTPGTPDAGNLKLVFGDNPVSNRACCNTYRELYWRAYLRNEVGWTGGGGNAFTSAMVLASPSWAQAAVGNIWTDATAPAWNYLMLDPVRGTDENGTLVTTRYNDFANYSWLGSASGTTPLFDDAHVGQWYCIEAHMKLNDAGQANGVLEYWVNGVLDAQRTGLNFLGSYNAFGINALFFENYWDGSGAPTTEARDWDNIVVATQRIGCGSGGPG